MNPANRFIAHYTLVRLLPQADAGEFANIGVVIVCPETKFFAFKLIRKYGRVTRFFEEFTVDLFTKLRKELYAEFDYVKKRNDIGMLAGRELLQMLQDLAKPRESMIRYASLRFVMTENPALELDKLFGRYIQRDFASARYHREEVLTRLVRRALATERLAEAFVPDEVGTDDFPVKLPMVHERNGVPVAAIKPLDLTQEEPVKIYEHGGLWLERFRRLNQQKQLPQGMLIAAEGPALSDERRYKAFMDVVHDLESLKLEVVQPTNTQRIVEFARNYVP